jgi:GH25 family lysozyme M1 (1,4-beta-N-acetylmuramidase)
MGAPFLVGDTSAYNPEPNFEALAADPRMVGIVLKATEGVSYAPPWFLRQWSRARAAGGVRYGFTWLRGAYHYLRFMEDGARQADFYLAHVDRAGGWGFGDILPIVDVERGGANAGVSDAGLVVDCVSAFAERVRARTGRDVILYGRGAMRDLGITSKMGCARVWTPNYGPTMTRRGLEAWSLDDIAMWQYTDGNSPGPANLPVRIPGFSGALDLSVVIAGNRQPWLFDVHHKLRMNRLDPAVVAMLAGAAVAGATMG